MDKDFIIRIFLIIVLSSFAFIYGETNSELLMTVVGAFIGILIPKGA
jgi:hypothetical protein